MVEAVKEMMVKHLGFGAFVGTNWMLLESDLVASIAGHAPEQEPSVPVRVLNKLRVRNPSNSVSAKPYILWSDLQMAIHQTEERHEKKSRMPGWM